MSESKSFWEHPIEVLEEALSIRKQMAALQRKLGGLMGREDTSSSPSTQSPAAPGSTRGRRRKRTMSAEARERIAAAQRARWAKVKRGGAAAKTIPAAQSGAGGKPGRKRKSKRTISPEARAKMADAARRRWAKLKRAA